MILVDTSVWIDFLTGKDSRQRRILHRLIEDEENICITEIILTEVLQGIRKDRDFRSIRSYLLDFPILSPEGVETYLRAAGIHRECRKKGKTIRKTVDCIIAALCIEHDVTLLHKDADFDRIASCSPLKIVKV